MSVNVGRNVANVSCDQAGCKEQTDDTYGPDAQQKALANVLKKGWYKSDRTGKIYCPNHKDG